MRRPPPTACIRFYVTDARQSDLDRQRDRQCARERAHACARWSRPRCGCSSTSSTTALSAIDVGELAPGNLTRLLTEIKEACQTYTGITEGTFYRDQAWYFYRLGRYIERADQTTRLLDIKYYLLLTAGAGSSARRSRSANGMRCCARPPGITPFAGVHPSDLTPARVAGFLLFNPAFPRSVHLCVREVDRALGRAQIALWAARRQRCRRGLDAAAGDARARSIAADPGAAGCTSSSIFCSGYLIAMTADLSSGVLRPYSRADAAERGDGAHRRSQILK